MKQNSYDETKELLNVIRKQKRNENINRIIENRK